MTENVSGAGEAVETVMTNRSTHKPSAISSGTRV